MFKPNTVLSLPALWLIAFASLLTACDTYRVKVNPADDPINTARKPSLLLPAPDESAIPRRNMRFAQQERLRIQTLGSTKTVNYHIELKALSELSSQEASTIPISQSYTTEDFLPIRITLIVSDNTGSQLEKAIIDTRIFQQERNLVASSYPLQASNVSQIPTSSLTVAVEYELLSRPTPSKTFGRPGKNNNYVF